MPDGASFIKPGAISFGGSTIPSFVAPAASSASAGSRSLMGGMSGGTKAQIASTGIATLGSLLASILANRAAGKQIKSQEQMSREQIAMQERILADQAKAQEKYYDEMKRQYDMQQELERQRFERQQGLLEKQYDEKKAASRPYYDYVWNYLNTPVK